MSEFLYKRTVNEYPSINGYNHKSEGRVLCWMSGGVASAIACKLALEKYKERCEFVFCDTNAEDEDSFRFMNEFCDKISVNLKVIKSDRFKNPEEVWFHDGGLNFAHGSPCSNRLKKEVRVKYQSLDDDFCHVFGFDYSKKEIKRARNMLKNHPEINAVFPLIIGNYDRDRIFITLKDMGIEPPKAYYHFLNNNCLLHGCVQGGIGYWQKMKEVFPDKYEYMADVENRLSLEKGKPVTLCKDQRKGKQGDLLFLKKNKNFPDTGTIDEIKGRQPIAPLECNGFCSTLDL